MTDQTKRKAYNVSMRQVNDETVGKNANGKDKIVFRAKGVVGGREIERTVVAQGEAAKLVAGIVGKDKDLKLRVLFDRAPDNDDGSKGGEFLNVVGIPREKKAA